MNLLLFHLRQKIFKRRFLLKFDKLRFPGKIFVHDKTQAGLAQSLGQLIFLLGEGGGDENFHDGAVFRFLNQPQMHANTR